jgi:hypothetical protein
VSAFTFSYPAIDSLLSNLIAQKKMLTDNERLADLDLVLLFLQKCRQQKARVCIQLCPKLYQ